MSRLTIVLVLAGVVGAGLVRLATRLLAWRRRKRFAEAFLSRFRSLARTDAFDEDTYAWLIARSATMQERLGPLGLNAYAGPLPYDLGALPADPLLINTLPELRSGRARPERVAQCEEALMRYLGALSEERAGLTRRFINPVVWVGEGAHAALLLPFLTLHWLGLFTASFVRRLEEHTLFRLLSGLVAVCGLAAAALIIILGWEKFTALTDAWISAAF